MRSEPVIISGGHIDLLSAYEQQESRITRLGVKLPEIIEFSAPTPPERSALWDNFRKHGIGHIQGWNLITDICTRPRAKRYTYIDSKKAVIVFNQHSVEIGRFRSRRIARDWAKRHFIAMRFDHIGDPNGNDSSK